MADPLTYRLESFDQSGAAFRTGCAKGPDPAQPCGDLLSYWAIRSDGRRIVLCANHAAAFAAQHRLPFPVITCRP